MSHPWFKDLDWNALLNKQITPPFSPNVSEEGWLNNFDKDFTAMSNSLLLLWYKTHFPILLKEPMLDEQGR